MRTVRILLVSLQLLLSWAAATAQDAQEMPPPPAPDAVRAVVRVHSGAKFGDSACADLGETPACAAETWLACLWRANPALCAQVGVADVRFPPGTGTAPPGTRIVVRLLPAEEATLDAAAAPDGAPEWTRSPLAFQRLAVAACPPGREPVACLERAAADRLLIFSRAGGRWSLAGWSAPRDGDAVCEHADTDGAPRPPCTLMLTEEQMAVLLAWRDGKGG
ncbi:MAG: hypothetical protein AB7N54_12145 [Alphaproteobacteria bacterium]